MGANTFNPEPTDTHVFPVTKSDHLIDVFVSNIHTAGAADFTINDGDLSVGTVVEFGVLIAFQRRERGRRFYRPRSTTQGFVIVPQLSDPPRNCRQLASRDTNWR